MLTFNDVMLLMGGVFAMALLMIPLVKRPRSRVAADGH